MGEESVEAKTFEYGPSYPLCGGEAMDTSLSLSAGSALIARQSGTYGARGDTTISIPCAQLSGPGASSDADSAAGGETDKTSLLTEKIRKKKQATANKLSMIFGVTIPCCLSIFCVILFLRIGFVLGQAGFWETMLMLFLGYLVVVLTVLSISAIATSATVGGGGVYCILSYPSSL